MLNNVKIVKMTVKEYAKFQAKQLRATGMRGYSIWVESIENGKLVAFSNNWNTKILVG